MVNRNCEHELCHIWTHKRQGKYLNRLDQMLICIDLYDQLHLDGEGKDFRYVMF